MKSNFIYLLLIIPYLSFSQIEISEKSNNDKNYFSIISNADNATILYDNSDKELVKKSAVFLAGDIEKVTGIKLEVLSTLNSKANSLIVVGSIGNSQFIDQLITSKKINVEAIRNQWERYIIETVKNPFPGIKEALVIVGSDKRGTAYGVFSISKEIGVSPWYWWSDVPVKKSNELYIKKGRFVSKGPSVKYRGIFINDEAPALINFAKEKFGGFNHKFYEKVYELLLRNNANYLWPAMWPPTTFFQDDPDNDRIADEYGIVISTSHHEPMMRTHEEWGRFKGGEWNYETNKEKLQEFWRQGVTRMKNYESVVTIGMRGDGDAGMSKETAVDLLKGIITDQRKIIEDVTRKPAEQTPQVWAIYKEVQDYYDKGLRVPDDVLVLLCDDNWGNLRYLPKKEDLNRKEGYGIYYHLEYVGGPTSYRWLNVSQIERVWEQMNLAYTYGAKDLWLVNVGDIKPMELPMSFFLDYAYNTDAIQAKDLPNYYVNWAKQQFGNQYATEIAELLKLYTKYNARRTPETLTPETYSVLNYREADKVVDDYNNLLERSNKVYDKLPVAYKSAYYQIVHSPIQMCSNLNEMYVAAQKNRIYGEQGRTSANFFAEKVKELFYKDAEFTKYYHEQLENGKWNHLMSQTHIGYTSWNHPAANKMPAVSYIQIESEKGLLGFVAEQGTKPEWEGFTVEGFGRYNRDFPTFDPVNNQSYYLEIFNRGNKPLEYTVNPNEDWIKLTANKGKVQFEEKLYVSIDWSKAPKGRATGKIVISSGEQNYSVNVPIRNDLPNVSGFVENNGVVSIEASNFTKKTNSKKSHWVIIPNLGRTHSSLTIEPANSSNQTLDKNSPSLEYEFTVFDGGDLKIDTYVSPTLNFKKTEGLKFGISIDDEQPQIININKDETKSDWLYPDWWQNSVLDHIKKKQSVHKGVVAGKHTLKIWMIDAGIVFQKFVIDAGGLKPSYLGPPEGVFVKSNSTKFTNLNP